jgi:hypothetical protein
LIFDAPLCFCTPTILVYASSQRGRHFNLKAVETSQRRFGCSITTDGCVVSALLVLRR